MGPAPQNRGPSPVLELVTPINKEKLHNYITHPPFLTEAASNACERPKGNDDFEHIIDNTSVVLKEPENVREVVRDILKGREKNDIWLSEPLLLLNLFFFYFQEIGRAHV